MMTAQVSEKENMLQGRDTRIIDLVAGIMITLSNIRTVSRLGLGVRYSTLG